jgi:hypothetical protein
MTVLRIILLMCMVALTARAQENPPQPPADKSELPPASCPVTVAPSPPYTPPPPYALEEDNQFFWLGTDKLWTALRNSGTWTWRPHKPGHEHKVQPLTEKTFWGSVNFNWRTEWPVTLKVTGRRLDGPAPPLLTTRSTNAFPGPGAAMLTGVYVPTAGCWEITAHYKGEKLSYVVWVFRVKD